MFKIAAIGLVASLTSLAHANAAGKIGYGSRVGMVLTIVSADGLDTDHAEIHAIHQRSDAAKFCREYENNTSVKCVRDELRTIPSFTYTANCESGVFQAVRGKYRFVGPFRESDNPMMIAYQVIALDTGEDLDGSEASGYPLAMDVFKHLCPSRVPGDIWISQ